MSTQQEHEVRSRWVRGVYKGLHAGWSPVLIETVDGRPVASVAGSPKAGVIAAHIIAAHNDRLDIDRAKQSS